jgi:hypothetical protein
LLPEAAADEHAEVPDEASAWEETVPAEDRSQRVQQISMLNFAKEEKHQHQQKQTVFQQTIALRSSNR